MIADIDNIKDLYFDGTAAQKGYLGNDLVYTRPPKYTINQYVGKGDGAYIYSQSIYGNKEDYQKYISVPMTDNGFDCEVDMSEATYLRIPHAEGIDHLPDFSSISGNCYLFNGNRYLEYVNFKDAVLPIPNGVIKMFKETISLKSVDLTPWDFSRVIYMDEMFMKSSIESVKFPKTATPNLFRLIDMFSYCESLKLVDFGGIGTREDDWGSTYCYDGMFYKCHSLEEIDLTNLATRRGSLMANMFLGCESLKKIKLKNFWVTNGYVFYRLPSLKDISGISHLTVSTLNLNDTPLSNASAMEFINAESWDVRNINIQFDKRTYDTLTQEQIATATSKGWNISY